ncbi:MAG: polysaccharide deacetylase family protein [Bacteroidota bacterium]
MMQLLIYSPSISPRIKYIFHFIFREVLSGEFELTSIAADFMSYKGPKMSYAETALADELFFRSLPFLNERDIIPISIKTTTFGDQEVPFPVKNSALPFDVFAASFYFLSRYEEYLPFNADKHGRYPPNQSLQYHLGLLDTPVIDGWALVLKNMLTGKFPTLTFGKRKFEFVPTIDVDRAYRFRANGLAKNTIRLFNAAINLNTEKLIDIISTGLGKNDPFDTYKYLAELHRKYNLRAIFFFLLAKEGHETYDRNINPANAELLELIKEVALSAQVGIHPSYASNTDTQKINEELTSLQQITKKKIDASRQHFLKLHLPQTYLRLIKAGINHDYSMGYTSQVGFRAGTCTSFFWYDLQIEKQSHLKVHPFAVMDVTLQQYLRLNPAQALAKIDELMAGVKLVNGVFCSLWHNESLSETGKWKGWKAVYESMLKNAIG